MSQRPFSRYRVFECRNKLTEPSAMLHPAPNLLPFPAGSTAVPAKRPPACPGVSFAAFCICIGILTSTTSLAQSVEGFTEPVHLVSVASPETGTIQDVLVRQGQSVKKGDPLIQMDQETLLPSLELAKARAEARAKLNSAKIELQVRERRLENFNRLGKEHSSSEEMLRATADVELAKTSVMAAEEEIREAVLEARRIEAQLERRTIRSPISGVVTRVLHQSGEFITSAKPQVVTVADLSQLRVVFHPSAQEAEALSSASSVEVRLERGREVVQTKIDFISPITSADSGTVRVELLLDNSSGRYRSGSRCWLLGAAQEKVPAPRSADTLFRRSN